MRSNWVKPAEPRLSVKSVCVCVLFLFAVLFPLQAQSNPVSGAEQANQATRDKIARYLRERFSLSSAAAITVSPLRPSIYPGFDQATVTIQDGTHKGSMDFYVSTDGRYLVEGDIFGLDDDPRTEVERLIRTQGEPSTGPASSPVTIVEYADLECPHCAEIQQFIEKQLLPKYAGKVRIIFKEYPLYSIHHWAVAAAVANECAYEIDPAAFLPYRDLIFQNQALIKDATATQQLLAYGVHAGLDREKLSACVSSQASLPHVRQDFLEGQKLGVESTPTFFINGKMLSGAASAQAFFSLVDQALAQAAKK
jgi:protein-disulfide isomerase